MNRKSFLTTSFSLIGISIWPEAWQKKDYSISILLGKGEPELYNVDIPLLKPVGVAFIEMQKAAKKEGITLEIVSAYRSFKRQKSIWNSKYIRNKKRGVSPE